MRERFSANARLLSCLGAVSFVVSLLAPTCTQTAIANGDTRTIRLYHAHTKETIEATFRVNGQYDGAVLKQLNWFLRDWRRDEPTTMDPRLFDIVWEVYRASGGGSEYVTVMSAYRSPETNAMLRRRSRAVAEYSQHMLGKAMDTSMPGMSMAQVRETGMRAQRGGVGYYPSANTPFVHLDVGSVRSWPRMSFDQLVRLFPDGKTVHLPSNGQPLARYEEARAEIAAGGYAIAPPSSSSSNFFAWLFGGSSRDGGDDEDAATAAAPRAQTASNRRGRGAVQVASTASRPAYAVSASTSASSFDDSGRDFFAQQANRTVVASAVEPKPSPVQMAAYSPPPAPAQTAIPEPAAASRPAPDKEATAESADDAGVKPVVTASIDHPAPPRRPSDLPTFEAPLPPVRPVALAALNSPGMAYASMDPGLRRGGDPIASLLDRSAPARTAEKPAGGTRGVMTTSVGPVTGLRAARVTSAAEHMPIVPARLDRSNFRAMTGHESATRMTTQTTGAPTLTATRSAARVNAAIMAPAAHGSASAFSAKATDLPTGSFAGRTQAAGLGAR